MGQGFNPQRLPPTSNASQKSQASQTALQLVVYNLGVPMAPSLFRFVNFLEWVTNSEIHSIYTYWFFLNKGYYMKHRNEQQDEEVHRARSGWVPIAGASSPVELGYATLLACGCVCQKLSALHCLGGFMEVSSHRHDWLLTQSPAVAPSSEVGGVWKWNFQASYQGSIFLETSFYSEATI